jgi:single-stranded DNA-binding protein
MGSLAVSGICRLTRDAEVKKTSMGTWYAIGIAAYRKNPKDGKQQVDFFDADLYIKNPPPGYEKNLVKGRLLYIETAYLRNDQFIGKDGTDKTRVKLQISGFELLGDHIMKVEEIGPIVEKLKPVSNSTHPSDLGMPISISMTKIEKIIPDKSKNKVTEEFSSDEEPPF